MVTHPRLNRSLFFDLSLLGYFIQVMLPELALQSSQFTTTNRATQLEVVDLGISRLTKASGSQFQVKHR
jgi:hypothetical protein